MNAFASDALELYRVLEQLYELDLAELDAVERLPGMVGEALLFDDLSPEELFRLAGPEGFPDAPEGAWDAGILHLGNARNAVRYGAQLGLYEVRAAIADL